MLCLEPTRELFLPDDRSFPPEPCPKVYCTDMARLCSRAERPWPRYSLVPTITSYTPSGQSQEIIWHTAQDEQEHSQSGVAALRRGSCSLYSTSTA